MLREETGPLTAQHQRLVVVLEVAGVEAFVRTWPGLPGRPLKDRHALARSFVAKAVLGPRMHELLLTEPEGTRIYLRVRDRRTTQ
jgi:hypothetical protein